MAAIRFLKEKHKNTILQVDNIVIEYIQAFKDKKPQTLIDLKRVEVLKGIWSLELLANSIVRKLIQIRRQLEAMNKQGMEARKEAENYYQYKCLSQAVKHDHNIFLERTMALISANGAIRGMELIYNFTFSCSS